MHHKLTWRGIHARFCLVFVIEFCISYLEKKVLLNEQVWDVEETSSWR